MNEKIDLQKYLSLFKQELTENLLPFWMSRCLDRENGGYFNCFTNDGSRLISHDKYTWSEGRFLWMFSRLATVESDLFDEAERAEFLSYAEKGKDFLLKNVLLGEGDYRCVFLTDAEGNVTNGYRITDKTKQSFLYLPQGTYTVGANIVKGASGRIEMSIKRYLFD